MTDLFQVLTYPIRALSVGVVFATSKLWSLVNKITSLASEIFFKKKEDGDTPPGSPDFTSRTQSRRPSIPSLAISVAESDDSQDWTQLESPSFLNPSLVPLPPPDSEEEGELADDGIHSPDDVIAGRSPCPTPLRPATPTQEGCHSPSLIPLPLPDSEEERELADDGIHSPDDATAAIGPCPSPSRPATPTQDQSPEGTLPESFCGTPQPSIQGFERKLSEQGCNSPSLHSSSPSEEGGERTGDAIPSPNDLSDAVSPCPSPLRPATPIEGLPLEGTLSESFCETPQPSIQDFERKLIEAGCLNPSEVAQKLYEKTRELITNKGLFEQAAENYLKTVYGEAISFQWIDPSFNFRFESAYLVIRRKFSSPSNPVTGQWFLPLNEETTPSPSFSVDHTLGWRLRKFLATFHHLSQAIETSPLALYCTNLQLRGTDQPKTSLEFKVGLAAEQIRKCLNADSEQIAFEAWKTLDKKLREACVKAKDSDTDDTSSKPVQLLNIIVLALYENPQLEFFRTLHPSLLAKIEQKPDVGIKRVFEAFEANKGKLGTHAKKVNDDKSKNDLVGYCDLLNFGRLPYKLCTLSLLNKEVVFYSFGTPTVEEGQGASINPIYEHWLTIRGPKHAYINLQPRVQDNSSPLKQVMNLAANTFGTKDETRRTKALEGFLKEKISSLPADGKWYNGSNEGLEEAVTFKKEALTKLTSLEEDSLVSYPAAWEADYSKQVEAILEMIHEIFFNQKIELTKKDRQIFIEWTKAFLTLILLSKYDVDYLNITCRDAMDRAGMLAALVRLLVAIMENNVTPQTLYEIVEGVCSTTFLTAEQAVEDGSKRRTRLLACWEALGLSLNKMAIERNCVIERLANHKTFQALKRELKREAAVA